MNKQIEEIEITENAIRESENDDKIYMLYNELELLIQSLGYQKVDKDSVILTKGAYESLSSKAKANVVNAVEIRKETAREIFAKIKQKGQFEYFAYDDDKYCVSSDNLEEIAKQLGVDIKE